ncbi:hypothetical protein [Halanaerobium congolense]|uniref:Uncharacterized protein n=1 Tax=Halanaerobium congolense TaxID=54121 RepID=A0A1G6NDS2_9FIRM|nr:hypothetical protein [Halanaerobium congolense]KXS48754.1 MAG: hypothetical protein AWL62_1678 [Halanaerobium sp. T82-1]PUU86687.1 MAG: hypothetical protein CI948_2757 [Halanaerobium sp.]PXV62440.1 hypothetical protein C8C78_1339 [Halanaerobium congolense]TDP11559.1 hypothetical protein C8C79_13513 [Halanaerobium congolense]TDS32236.1 hypothetical protein BY453_10829 [Halanaerobium congolense]
MVNILEEQNIELYNIKSTLQNHNNQFDEMGYTIKKIHNQIARLSIGQSELDMKIDKLKNSKLEKNEENINSM